MRAFPMSLSLAALLVAGCSGGGNNTPIDARQIADAQGVIDATPDAPPPDAAYACPVRVPGTSVTLAKNIIVVIGDGMGPEHIKAGAVAKGAPLSFTQLATPISLNTDSLEWDFQSSPTDSAAAATAIATGMRVRNDRVSQSQGTTFQTIGEHAKAAGKAVGVVTTSASFDATPAAFVAHREDRNDLTEIATEIISVFKPAVLLGGGSEVFEANAGALLTLAASEGYTVVRTADELMAAGTTEPLLGVFSTVEMAPSPFEALFPLFTTPVNSRTGSSTDPLLSAMVSSALTRLETDPEGFLLVIENEQTDTLSHHAVVTPDFSKLAVPAEVAALDDAVAIAIAWVEDNDPLWAETLMLVGADHETGGYSFDGSTLASGTFPVSPNHTRTLVQWYIKGPGTSDLSWMCGLPDLFLLMAGQPAQ